RNCRRSSPRSAHRDPEFRERPGGERVRPIFNCLLYLLRAVVRFLLLIPMGQLAVFPRIARRAFAPIILGIAFAFEPQDILDVRNVALAPNKQNTYLTPVSAPSYTQRPR